ncbi:MAG: hypothetical protein U0271_08635 [Polyangiaceae bacterium]
MNRLAMVVSILVIGSLCGCGDDKSTASSTSAAASGSSPKTGASGAPAGSATTAQTTGAPSNGGRPAEEKVDKVMVECTWTKGFKKNSFDEESLEYDVKNVSGMDLNYVQFNMYFYDKDGKQLQPNASSSQNGQPWLKADESKKVALSPQKAKMPAGTDTVECEVSAGASADDKKWSNPKMGHYDRPKGGVK